MLAKKLQKTLLAAITFAAISTSAQAELTSLETVEWGTSTYTLIDTSSWFDAQDAAIALGGNLITINSQEENDFIYDLWGLEGTSDFATQYLWTGLNDYEIEGTFTWISGEDSTYTNFLGTEPNGGTSENAVLMWTRGSGSEGTWNDFDGYRGPDYQTGVFGVVEVTNFTNIEEIANVPLPFAVGGLLLAGLLLTGHRNGRK
jgi:hypothetical protein